LPLFKFQPSYYEPSLEKLHKVNLDVFKVDSLTDLDTSKSISTDNLPKPPNIRFYINLFTLHTAVSTLCLHYAHLANKT